MSDGLIGALAGGLVAAVLAGLGFWITYKTSIAALQQTMLQNAAIKHADFILLWIKELRDDTAQYIKLHQNIMLARRASPAGKVPVEDRDKLLALSEVRARLKMMIRQDTNDETERVFLSLISEDVSKDEKNARKQRSSIIDASRDIQKTAWRLAKQKITNPNQKEPPDAR
jgi:hypothetical protein